MDNETEKCIVYKRPHHSMAEQLQEMWKQDELCDVTIEVEKQSFRAHKVILSAAIHYFRKMFMCKPMDVDQKIIWVVPDIKPENMETFINFAYSGEIKLTEKNIQSLLIDANHLGLTDIITESVRSIECILNPTNAFLMYQIGKTLKCPTLMEKSREIITGNFSEAINSQEFLNISSGFLEDILKSESVQLGSREVAFDGAMKWMTHKIKKRKHHLSTLLELVNLSDLNSDYLTGYFFKAEMIVISNKHKNLVHEVMAQYHQNKRQNVVSDRKPDNNYRNSLLAFTWKDQCLFFETYDSEKDKWCVSNWNPEIDDRVVRYVHNNVIYLSTWKGHMYMIDVQQRRVDLLTTIPNSGGIECLRNLTVLDDYLYNFDYDRSKRCTVGLRYCLKSKQWEAISPMNGDYLEYRFFACQGYIYAIKSRDLAIQRYCPQTNKWERVLYNGRNEFCLGSGAAVLNEKIYFCGGWDDCSILNAAWCFDPETRRWQQLASMNQTRHKHSMVAWNGKLVAIGGCDENFSELSSVEVYDPISNSWSMVSPMEKIKGEVFGVVGITL